MIVNLEIKDNENKITEISNCEIVYTSIYFSCEWEQLPVFEFVCLLMPG